MVLSMVRGVANFKSIEQSVSSSDSTKALTRGEGLGMGSCSFPFSHVLTQNPSCSCTVAQGEESPFYYGETV